MRVYIALGLAALSVSGCASIKENYTPRTEQISFPPLNEVRTATIGENMVSQGTATTTRGVYLRQENNIAGFRLSPGFYPQTGIDDEYVFTGFEIRPSANDLGVVQIDGGLFGQAVYPRGIRFSRSEQKTCAIVPNIYGMTQPVCDTEYAYEFTERPFVSANNFQQTLIYSGRVGDKIKVSYREFSGDIARSAFTNDAEYDLSTSDMIAYRGARIRVISANNESIQYEVISNFNLAN